MGLGAQYRQVGVLRGILVDRATRLPIENVNVFFQQSPKGTVTDRSGRFMIDIPLGRSVQVIFSHVSYDKQTKTYRFDRPDTLELETSLQPHVIPSGEVTVTGTRPFSEQRARYALSGVEIQKSGEADMEHALRYLLPEIVKPYEVRIMRPSQDFTLYVNGTWEESYVLNEIDPATVTRVLVWDDRNWTPVGLPVRRGSYVVSIETEETSPSK